MKKFLKIFINLIPFKNHRRMLRKKLNKEVSCQLGEYSYSGAKFISPNTKIGKYCSIAIGSMIGLDYHPCDFVSTSPVTYKNVQNMEKFKKVNIGNDVWIGANAIVLPNGGNIGNGAIIGAGSVVTHDVPPYAIVAGVPAKIIRYRFNESQIEKLEKIQWWDFPKEIIEELPFENIQDFLKKLDIS